MKSRCTGTGVITEYEPGELVKIKSNIKVGDQSGIYSVTKGMAECAGLTLAIEGRERIIDSKYYKIAGVDGYWWTQELFEPVEQFSSGGIVPADDARRIVTLGEMKYTHPMCSCGTVRLILSNERKNKSGIESRKDIRKRLLKL